MAFIDTLWFLTNDEVKINEKMSAHTSFGVGGKAKYFISVNSLTKLRRVLCQAKLYKIPYKLIGNGTNLLVSDTGYNGAVISLKGLNSVRVNGNILHAEAGANLSKLLYLAEFNGLSGLEHLTNIPATLGGALVMNAGAFHKSVSDNLISLSVLYDGKTEILKKEDCGFGYRKSSLGDKVILSADFNLKKTSVKAVKLLTENYKNARKSQPKGRSAGSVFKNPRGDYSGRIIESLGLKNFSVGKAYISPEHANFIINQGDSASDIYELIKTVQVKVYNESGILLIEEIEYLGEF